MNKVKAIFTIVLFALMVSACGAQGNDSSVYVISPGDGKGQQIVYKDKGTGEYSDITTGLTEPSSAPMEHEDVQEVDIEHSGIFQVSKNTLSRYPLFGINEELKCHSFNTILDTDYNCTDGKIIEYKYQEKIITEKFQKNRAYECYAYSLYCYGSDENTGTQYVVHGSDQRVEPRPMPANILPVNYLDVGGNFTLEGDITCNSSMNDVIAAYGQGVLDIADNMQLLTYYINGGGSLCFTWDMLTYKITCVRYMAP